MRCIAKADLNAIIGRLDVQSVIDQVDVNAVLERVDIDAIIARTEIGELMVRSGSAVVARSLDAVRTGGAGVDGMVHGWVDRLLRRGGPNRARGPAVQVAQSGPRP